MTRFVGTPLRGIEFSSPSDEAFSSRVNLDSQARIRIDAGGRITWSSGSASGDTNLYRDGANILTTDDVFKATGGLVTFTVSGAPTASVPDGGLAVDIGNNEFYFRANGTWHQVIGGGGGGNASLTISDSMPTEEIASGDLWFESDTGKTFVYYDSFWVEIGATSYGNNISSSDGIAYKAGYPASQTSSGTLGQISIDGANGVMYVCTGTNTWQRVSLNSSSFSNPGGFI